MGIIYKTIYLLEAFEKNFPTVHMPVAFSIWMDQNNFLNLKYWVPDLDFNEHSD
jgi:hypothetical protein